jgi:hypothetical protein
MKIDWEQRVGAQGVGETTSVLLRPRAGALMSESGLESTEAAGGTAVTESERLERLSEALAATQPMLPEGEQDAVKEIILDGARTGLAKVFEGEPPESFTLGEHVGLEAVILTNGERPSLFVRDGFVDLAAPDIGNWEQDLDHFRDKIRKVIASVGKIVIPVGPRFAGTCFVIAEGLVLTNRHVLEEIAKQDSAGGWTLNWPSETNVDFVGEDGSDKSTKFRVIGVAFAGPDPINRTVNFKNLDMAMLRVDPGSDADSRFPDVVTFEKDPAQPQMPRDLYVVGFPGRPEKWLFGGTPPAGYETTQVIASVFNNRFGVKRLAPGELKAGPGQVADDAKGWICSHDASTLGGNSGSCVVDLSGDGLRIVALHFAGAARAQNWAHAAARLQEQLAAHSATFVA